MAKLLELENSLLHERIESLAKENAQLKGNEEAAQLTLEIQSLQEQLDAANRRLYGVSSEKRSEKADSAEKKPQMGHGPTPQPDLPMREVHHKLTDEERSCRSCGGHMDEIRGMTDDSLCVSLVRRQFFIQKTMRAKYRCTCGGDMKTAGAGELMIPGGRYTVDVAAHVAEQKYLDHVPLDRQRRSMNRQGLNVSTSALWDQIDALATELEPVYDLLKQYILCADIIGMDETNWYLLDQKPRKTWWAWTLTCPGAVCYEIAPSRSAKTAHALIGDFEGIIVCDGYRAYETLRKLAGEDSLTLALCMAHARRKFVEAEPNYPQCKEAIKLIGQLFAIDRDTDNPALLSGDEKKAAMDARLKERQKRGPPILDALREWAFEQRGLPKSALRKAIDYLLGHWKSLTVFLEEPMVPLDNNASERALRGLVVGRNNHYGSRSERGTRVAAILYSIMETAKQNRIDPHQWVVNAVAMMRAETGVIPLPLA